MQEITFIVDDKETNLNFSKEVHKDHYRVTTVAPTSKMFAFRVESHDGNACGHIERTSAYIRLLLDAMLEYDVYTDEIRGIDTELFISSARLHDIGKICIPDEILDKPSRLTDEEFEIVKTHAEEGVRIINHIISPSGEDEFLRNAALFACCHHERWDGRGYPYGLEREKIPLHGRVMAFADVYDALISERPYKKAFSHEEALRVIMVGADIQFDPLLAEAFEKKSDQLKAICENRPAVR